MNLNQKLHSIWRDNAFLRKGNFKSLKLLAAIGLLGGFFALGAWATEIIFDPHIIYPNGYEIWGGLKNITWTTTGCQDGDVVNLFLLKNSTTSSVKINGSAISCGAGIFSFDTKSVADANNDYKIKLVKTGTDGSSIVEDISDDSFTIDNSAPVVGADALTSPNGGQVLMGGRLWNITWNTAKISDANLGSNPISLDYSTDGVNWNSIASKLPNSGTYSWTIPSIDSKTVKVRIIATDLVGNFAIDESDGVFEIDSTKPTAVVTVDSGNTINENNLTKIVTVTYSEPMDASGLHNPAIAFSATSGTWTAGAGIWSGEGNTIWTQSFAITNAQEETGNVGIFVNHAQDVAGNAQAAGVLIDAFSIDTRKPTVASATANPDPAKEGTVNVQVVFSENIDTSILPIIQITGIAGGPVTVDETSYSGKTWSGSFSLADNNEEKTAVISVVGAKDVSGNLMADNLNAGTFKVDMVHPIADSISIGSGTIADSHLIQGVTVTYNEPMSSVAPHISFSDGSGIWNSKHDGKWNDAKTMWTELFETTDAGIEVSGASVTVDDATDVAGNKQFAPITSATFDIDTKNPTVVLGDNHPDNIVKNGDVVLITATFADGNGIDGTDGNIPKITVDSVVSGEAMSPTADSKVWTYSWTVPTDHNGPANVSIVAKDTFGNLNEAATGKTSYIIDNTAPTFTLAYDPNRPVNGADTVKITATFTEANKIDEINAPQIKVDGYGSKAMTEVDNLIWTYDFDVPSDKNSNVSVRIKAYDVAGNEVDQSISKSILIDNTAPTFTVNKGTDAGPVKNDLISVTVNEANGIAFLKYGFSPNEVCDSSDAYSTDFTSGTDFVIAGNHNDYLCVEAADVAGNVGYGLVGKLNTDNIAPVVSVDSLSTNDSTPQLSGKVNDGSASVVITVNGHSYSATLSGSGADVTWNADVTNALADGIYDVVATATDPAGNVGNDSTTNELRIDTTPPTVSDNIPSAWQTVNFDVVFACGDGAGVGCLKVYYTIDGSDPTTLSSYVDADHSWKFTVSNEGVFTIKYFGVDAVGNPSPIKTAQNVLKIDKTAPVAPVVALTNPIIAGGETSAAITGTGEANTTINWTIKDGASGEKSGTGVVDGSGNINITGIDVSSLADGTLKLSAILTDEAGLQGAAGIAHATKDTALPTVTNVISDKADGFYKAGENINIKIVFSEAVNVTGIPQLQLETGAIDEKANYTGGTGTNTLTFSYVVQAGDNSNDLDYTGVGALDLNGGAISDIAGNTTVLTLPAVGGTGSLGENKNIVIDTIAPSGYLVKIDQAVISNSNKNALSFKFANAEIGATYKFTISAGATTCEGTGSAGSGGGGSICGAGAMGMTRTGTITSTDQKISSIDVSNFPDGKLDLSVILTDKAGNTGDPASDSVSKDTVAPIITVPNDITQEATSPQGGAVTFAVSSDDSSPVTCSLASGSTFALGDTTVKCNATDAAGNPAIEKSFKVTVKDTTPPTISNTPADITGIEATSSASAIVTYTNPTAFDIVSGNVPVICVPASGSAFPVGSTTVTCTAKDAANNTVTSSFGVTVQDTKAPVISGETPVLTTSSLNPTISANFSDASGIDVSGVSVEVRDQSNNLIFDTPYFTVTSSGIVSNTSAINLEKNKRYGVKISGLKDVYGNVTPDKTWSFMVANGAVEIDTTPPTATSDPADGATSIEVGISPTITFSEEMNASTIIDSNIQLRTYTSTQAIPVVLTSSVSGGKTMVTINPNSDLSNNTKYYFYISGVKDLAGNSMAASWTLDNEQSHEFTTAPAHIPLTQYSIDLKKGWNLISLPLIPDNSVIGSVLGNLNSTRYIDIVQYYDAKTESWKSYRPCAGGSLKTMEDGKGYWVYMKSDQTLTVSGQELPSAGDNMLKYTITGKKWNLIGFKSAVSETAGKYISQMSDSDVLVVYKDGQYKYLTKDGLMEPGFGYWFYTYDPDGFDIIPK